ncbi:17938_t:CDS:2, partial [Rhizophagus irregularis]
MDQLKNQLSNLKISYENTDNRRELVSLLEDALSQKIENTENQILSTDMLDSNEEI